MSGPSKTYLCQCFLWVYEDCCMTCLCQCFLWVYGGPSMTYLCQYFPWVYKDSCMTCLYQCFLWVYGSPSMSYLCQCFPWVYGGPPLKTHCWPAPCLSWPGTYNRWSPYWSLYLHSLVLCKIKSNIKYFWPDIHSNLTSTNLCCLIGLVTPSYLCCSPTNPR